MVEKDVADRPEVALCVAEGHHPLIDDEEVEASQWDRVPNAPANSAYSAIGLEPPDNAMASLPRAPTAARAARTMRRPAVDGTADGLVRTARRAPRLWDVGNFGLLWGDR